jgi:hypothetical protein
MIHNMIQVRQCFASNISAVRFISEISGLELIFFTAEYGEVLVCLLIQTPSLAKAPGNQSALSGSSKVAAGTALGLLGASECLACFEDHRGLKT